MYKFTDEMSDMISDAVLKPERLEFGEINLNSARGIIKNEEKDHARKRVSKEQNYFFA